MVDDSDCGQHWVALGFGLLTLLGAGALVVLAVSWAS
jgi:hypothetical protein